jgi:uncharacterized protein
MSEIAKHIDAAVAIAREHGASRVILFGGALESPSDARDLDLAIEGIPGWNFFGLAAELEAKIPVHVDVIPLDQVRENHFTRTIRRRGRVIYERQPIGGDGGRTEG